MSKFYAVAAGRLPGIYRSWSECERQVKGFSGALYKSFKSQQDAERWMTPQDIIVTDTHIVDIYTDGSHQTSINYLGIGAWCDYQGVEYKLSRECDQDMLEEYGITEVVSNPTAEFLAFAQVLSEFIDLQPATPLTLRFYIDYIGVRNWMDNSWQCRKPYIKQIKELCDMIIDTMSCQVEIVHVKGHSGNYGNEMADACATDTSEYNNFHELRKVLNKLT